MCTNTSQTTQSGKFTSLELKSNQRPINRMVSCYRYLALTCVDRAILDILAEVPPTMTTNIGPYQGFVR